MGVESDAVTPPKDKIVSVKVLINILTTITNVLSASSPTDTSSGRME